MAFFLADPIDALIISIIILLSSVLGVIQEKGALNALEKLIEIVEVKCNVMRDGISTEIPLDSIVPGDIVFLKAGDVIPADCFVLNANHCFINESSLTGESFGVEKEASTLSKDTPLRNRSNTLFMGTYVISGSVQALVIFTAKSTEFGRISHHLKTSPPPTAFEIGIQHFGYFLVQMTFILVFLLFGINVLLKKPILESFLFSLALGIGFTPQLLPVIITINLARGSRFLAQKKVIVKRLSSIENFGSMNVLCCDKTGTLTTGEISLKSFCDAEGSSSEKTLLLGGINAFLQTGSDNPLDLAILKATSPPLDWKKLDEIPFDFSRKRVSLLVSNSRENLLITKGAFSQILSLCSTIETTEGKILPIRPYLNALESLLEKSANQGLRLLGVAYRSLNTKTSFCIDDEKEMIFLGYLEFSDSLKPGIIDQLQDLQALGIKVKIISGDNHFVVSHVGESVGVLSEHVLTGCELNNMSEATLASEVLKRNLFAEIEPLQKERLILALRKAGNIVGFLGDGINDITAMHAADVSISVDNAASVAKTTADFILLEKDLTVLKEGIQAGRKTFANTLKYIFMATSANFGNMFSMTLSSLFLNFLPLLPKQILLTNLFTDIPELTISTDNVDEKFTQSPPKWSIRFIRNFMIVFGLISSIYDFLTFGLLLWLTDSVQEFRTGWFIESVISAVTILFIIRTRRSLFISNPSKFLAGSIFLIIFITLALLYTPLGTLFGFVPLKPSILLLIGAIILLYGITAEMAKKIFYRVKH